jgi:geranylgeranyl diphosphate synthase type II
MHTVPYLQEIIQQEINRLDIPSSPAELYEPIYYSMSMGGKRIRPVLTLIACDLFDGNIELALAPAIGLEIFHNFTLVHDDIMDNAPIRRGKDTIYRKWSISTAILSGDTMFAIACEYISRTHPGALPAVLGIFNQTAREVCEGQQMDMNFESDTQVTLHDYTEMIRLKTAVLLGCCLKIGSLVAGAGNKDAENLYHFGENLGIAFQIQDDLLDTFGDPSVFGKKTGGDIETNKKTWLFLKAMEIGNNQQQSTLQQYYGDPLSDAEAKYLTVKGIFNDLKVQELARQEITVYYNKAQEYLKRISLPEPKMEVLRTFCDKIINRTY